MLTVANVSRTYGAHQVLAGVTLRVDGGRRIAIVGPNGAGKTTLLRMIAGLEKPDSGTVQLQGGVRVGYLSQDVAETRGHSVLEEVLRGADDIRAMERRLRELELVIGDHTDPDHESQLEEYGKVQTHFEAAGGYEIDVQAQRILGGLGFSTAKIAGEVSDLSGGWMMRAAMARLLLSAPDVLLLDEPTNHLDLGSVVWLEDFVRRYDGAVVLVSHDREFLNNVIDHVVELDGGSATEYTGNYDAFVEQRIERMEQLIAAKKNQDAKIDQLQLFADRFRAKASKSKQAQAKLRQIGRIQAEAIEVPDTKTRRVKFGFPEPPRSGRVVANFEGVRKVYGDNVVFDHLDLVIERGQCVALVGPNGAGKSTILKMLANVEKLDAGELTLGGNVLPAYYAQHQLDTLDGTKTVMQEFLRAAESAKAGRLDTRRILGSFMFSGAEVDKYVEVLSGGEKARLALAELMCRPANLLLLDEPTNHLDITSRDVLEDALLAYDGTMVLVTHDRHLIRSVADTIIEVQDGQARVHLGGWDEYLERRGMADERTSVGGVAAARAANAATAKAVDPQVVKREKKKRDAELRNRLSSETRDLRAEVSRLERSLAATEAEVAELTRQLADPAVYGDDAKVKRLVAEHGSAKDRAGDLMQRWEAAALELEEVTDRIERELTDA